ncbi:MAG TPA: MFS transporter [Streptosporangiaceae bacterium]|nr:MFS transporter [Streptosporangiaceae bacterium]
MAESSARKWWALIAIAASVLVVGLDLTVLNLALPTIATDLHASTSDLQWISDSYSLVLAAVMLPAGLLGDRLGRKKVLLVALVLFGAASAACAYATGTGELIAARAVLGIGAAAIFPLSLSVIPVLFAPEERQRAIALMASATFISFPIGPVVGGYLLDHFWWGSVFLINVPVVVLALIAVTILLPESRSAERPGVDVLGVILSSAGLAGLTYGFIKAGQDSWTDATALAAIVAGVAVLAVLVGWECWLTGRTDDPRGGRVRPLIELRLFRSAGFTWGTILSTMVSFAMFGIFFVMPQYFQEVRGADAMGSGLRLLPMVGGMIIGMIGGTVLARGDAPPRPPREGIASPRKSADGTASAPLVSAKLLVTVGFTIMAAALAVGASTSASSGTGFAAAWFAVFGLGLGMAMPQAMNAAIGALSAERSGAGSALISALRQVGATIGVAILGTVLGSVYASHLTVSGLPAAVADAAKNSVAAGVAVAHQLDSAALLGSVRDAFVTGMDTMLWVCAGIALVSAVLAAIFLPRRAEGITEPAVAAGAPATPGVPAPAEKADRGA